jgi:hypothetical protein
VFEIRQRIKIRCVQTSRCKTGYAKSCNPQSHTRQERSEFHQLLRNAVTLPSVTYLILVTTKAALRGGLAVSIFFQKFGDPQLQARAVNWRNFSITLKTPRRGRVFRAQEHWYKVSDGSKRSGGKPFFRAPHEQYTHVAERYPALCGSSRSFARWTRISSFQG